jgi:hypothetical protein
VTDTTGGFDLDLAVSSIAADGGDNQIMMRVLMERLGDRLRIEREGRLRKTNVIRRVEIRLQDAELTADLQGTSPSFSVGRISGGIRIRSEQTDAAGWIRTLLEVLKREADHNAVTRQTLESLVIGSP